MRTIQVFLYCLLGLLAAALSALSADVVPGVTPEAPAVKLTAPPVTTGFYADTFLSLATQDFDETADGYGIGVGYQITKHWGADVRLAHHGLDIDGHTIQSIGGRLVARMPFDFIAPYSFLGGTFNLEADEWRLQPGAGIELGLSRKLQGLRLFGEAGLDADLRGSNGYLFTGGLRWRF